MSAITLTPVDLTTAAVVVNSDILYHVFTINGVTRVFFSKGGKSPYQIDVQETASAIAALCPNLVEVTTVNGTEYLFIGSGGAGPGLGIMFIEDDGSGGSKITFRYTEESGNTMFYSSDSPSVLAGRINAQSPSPSSAQLITISVPVSSAELLSLHTNPVVLVQSPGPGYGINVINAVCNYSYGTSAYSSDLLVISNPSGYNTNGFQFLIVDNTIGFSSVFPLNPWYSNAGVKQIYENEDLIFISQTGDLTSGDGSLVLTVTYQIISI